MLSLLHISIAYERKHQADPVDYTVYVQTVSCWKNFIKALFCKFPYMLLYKYICHLNEYLKVIYYAPFLKIFYSLLK